MQAEEVWKLVSQMKKILVANGKKVEEFLPGEIDKDEALAKVTGRTGNLRAPVLRRGDVLYVGYNDELYSLISAS